MILLTKIVFHCFIKFPLVYNLHTLCSILWIKLKLITYLFRLFIRDFLNILTLFFLKRKYFRYINSRSRLINKYLSSKSSFTNSAYRKIVNYYLLNLYLYIYLLYFIHHNCIYICKILYLFTLWLYLQIYILFLNYF